MAVSSHSDPTAICTSAWETGATRTIHAGTAKAMRRCLERSCGSISTSRTRRAVPESNPNPTAADPFGLIWAKGLRNPWRFSFDRATNDLYIADVGQYEIE